MNRMCARLLNKKSIHTVKCIGSRAIDNALIVCMFAPVILTIYLHILTRAVVDRDLT